MLILFYLLFSRWYTLLYNRAFSFVCYPAFCGSHEPNGHNSGCKVTYKFPE